MAVQSDGKIIIAATTVESGGATFVGMARYNANGSADHLEIYYGIPFYMGPRSIAIQNDGKIVVAGNGLLRFKGNLTFDSTFNENGIRVLGDPASAVAIQNDGKIVLAGSTTNSNFEQDFAVSRYNADGSSDNTFSGDGKQTTDFGGTDQEEVTAMTIQSDGKIIVAGYTLTGGNTSFAIARYNVNGNPDNTFSGDGKQLTGFASGSSNYLTSIALQGDGKLLAIGSSVINGSNSDIAVARYNINGNPDNSFDGDGTLTFGGSFDHTATYYTCTAVQGDGKILAAGYTWNGTNYDFAIVRYNTNGSLDNTFSGDGKQTTDFGSSDIASAIAVQSDGKILVGGTAWNDFAMVRYNSDGSLDLSFDGDGLRSIDFGGSDNITSLALQTDGKIVAAGTVLARFNLNGTLDLTFNGTGIVLPPAICRDVAIQSDGKIVIVGAVSSSGMAARYNIDGSPDMNFGTDGLRIIYEFDNRNLVCTSVAIQQDGKLVIGGYSLNNERFARNVFALLRLEADAERDFTFNGGEVVFTLVDAYATSLLIDAGNKIILGGYVSTGGTDNFAIERFNTNGSLDNTFNGDGQQITQASPGNSRIAGMALSDNKLYVAGSGQFPGYLGMVARYLTGPGLTVTTGVLEAELAVLNGAAVASNNAGFTGTGFADYTNNTGDYIEWTLNKTSPGQVVLDFRYANGGSFNRPLRLEINGVVVSSGLAFPSTGSWTTWSASQFVTGLPAGANKIRLTTIGSNGANVDHLAWSDTTIAPPDTSGVLEAELAALNQAVVASGNAGFTGTGYADYTNNTGDYIEWTLNKTNPGLVSLSFRYALAGTSGRPLKLEVNGVVVSASLNFPPTSSWTNWGTVQINAGLITGINKIRLTTIGANGPNVDNLAWQNATASSGILEAELAVLSQATVASNYTGFTGTGFADYTNNTGDYVEWTLIKSGAAPVNLSFRYALGGAYGRPLRLEVNGVTVAASLAFAPTGSWTTWSTSNFTANLIAGANKIRLTAIGSNGPNLDHLAWSDAIGARRALPAISFAQDQLNLKELSVTASPNPSTSSFNIWIYSNATTGNVSLIVTDLAGRVIEQKNNILPGRKIEIGNSYQPGAYLVKILQGNNYKVVKLIKGR